MTSINLKGVNVRKTISEGVTEIQTNDLFYVVNIV